jgi:hypothetical protein
MVTIAEFRERFLDFSDSGAYPDSRIQLFLDDSSLLIGDNWGTCKDLGIMYLTAHYLVISNAENSGITSSANQVSSKSVGSVSESFATPTFKNENDYFYSSTSYGQRYLSYKKIVGVGSVVSV